MPNSNILHRPEILAPAGDIESVYAAMQNGADAVYLGQLAFSARQNAINFDREGLSHAVSYCHARGALVYQTLNTLIFDSQWSELLECIRTGCEVGVDAFILQDWGAAATVRQLAPDMPIHGSTQMSVHSRRGAVLLKELGFLRVVLARELSKEEIADIVNNVDIETEVFVQGALCMSVSGQCYISGMLGGRSGNRGLCAGTCRMPFSAGKTEDHTLSLKDLCLADKALELAELGVTSLKIEGRMKRPEYVAAAAELYNLALNGEEYSTDIIQSVFSRGGFTEGYYSSVAKAERFGVRGRDDVTSATDALLRSLRNTYQKEVGFIPVSAHLTLTRGVPAVLELTDDTGNSVTVTGQVAQEAINRPLTAEAAKASLFKLGGTIFTPGEFTADIEEGLMLPAAALNALRREAAQKLLQERERIVPVPCSPTNQDHLNIIKNSPNPKGSQAVLDKGVRLRLSSINQFAGLTKEELSSVAAFSIPCWELERLNGGELTQLLSYKDKVIVEPERFVAGREQRILNSLEKLKNAGFSRLLCNNAAHIKMADEVGMIPHGGVFLNAANTKSLEVLASIGVVDQQLSFELRLQDGCKIKEASNIPCVALAYGYLPLMLLRTCPLLKDSSCAECPNTLRKSAASLPPTLTDRIGKNFPITCVNSLYSELLNCQPLWMLDRLKEVALVGEPLLYFTYEAPAEVSRILSAFRNATPPEGDFTRGLYYRAV